MRYHQVARDGFMCAYGLFYANRVERVESSRLRQMFLPNVTAEAKRKFRVNYGDTFVRAQLKHYGVEFDESEISGNGTRLMQKVLEEGKCDQVPDDIAKLLEELLGEWLEELTFEELAAHPEGIMKRLFLSSGQPDPTKTTTVVGIPLSDLTSLYAPYIHAAASRVPGLHHETGSGPDTDTIFLGWDRAAVVKAADSHADIEAKKIQEANEAWVAEREQKHADYLENLKTRNPSYQHCPMGSYIVDCDEIARRWPDFANDLTIDVHPTDDEDVYKADFEFGIITGVVIMSAKASALANYGSGLNSEAHGKIDEVKDEDADDDDEVKVEDGIKVENEIKVEDDGPTTGTKRKANAPGGRGRPPKRARPVPTQPLEYMMKLRCRDAVNGTMHWRPQSGTITFTDKSMAIFTATVTLPCVGQNVTFTARKTDGLPPLLGREWHDYSSKKAYNKTPFKKMRYGHWL